MCSLSRAALFGSIALALFIVLSRQAVGQTGILNPWSAGQQPEIKAFDTSRPVERGYIIPSAQPRAGGAELTVDIFHQQLNSPVTLILQALIEPGPASPRFKPRLLQIEVLSQSVADNPDRYHSRRVFQIDYQALNARLAEHFKNAPQLQVGPGVPLYVYARWEQSGHQWGGVDRSGVFFLPGTELVDLTQTRGAVTARRPDVLDMSFQITSSFAAQFNDPKTQVGLKVNEGFIRSRVEGEGKYQIPEEDFTRTLRHLLRLANQPNEITALLGPNWKLKLEDRYLLKDSRGQMRLDRQGLPMPDPMVDTYYDNASFDAAANDVAIRYRYTAQNQTGAWNIKPGASLTDADGITYRVEYGVDTTSDDPQIISRFADSSNPLNPFARIARAIPGARPSEFLNPAVKITDFRYKFKLEHSSGVIVEISMDDVRAENLRDKRAETRRFFQLEMDIDHLATQSTNVQTGSANSNRIEVRLDSPTANDRRNMSSIRDTAFFDGRPVMHEIEDLDPSSPVRTKNKADFETAAVAIRALRDRVVGSSWLPGAQKYAWAARELGLLRAGQQEGSASVRALVKAIESRARGAQDQARACFAQVM